MTTAAHAIALAHNLADYFIKHRMHTEITRYSALPYFQEIIDDRGAVYFEHPMKGDGLGLTESDEYGTSIMVNSKIDCPERKNFTTAHEIGRLLLHVEKTKVKFLETPSTLAAASGPIPQQKEIQANKFAAHLLLPDKVFKFQVLSQMNAYRIKHLTGISIESMQWRVVEYLTKYFQIDNAAAIAIAEEYCKEHKDVKVAGTEFYRVLMYGSGVRC